MALQSAIADDLDGDKDEALLGVHGALPWWFVDTIPQVLVEVYASLNEGGDQALLGPDWMEEMLHLLAILLEGDFKILSEAIFSLIDRWFDRLSVDQVLLLLDQLRQKVGPDPSQRNEGA